MKKMLVIGEVKEGEIRNVSYEAIAAAKLIADVAEVVAVVPSDNADDLAATFVHFGADRAIAVKHPALAQYTTDAFQQAILQVVDREQPDWILMGHTSIGKDLSPRLAVKLDAGLISDVVTIETEHDRPVFTRPIYSGKAFERKTITSAVGIVTVRPNNIAPLEKDEARTGDADSLTLDLIDLRTIIKKCCA